MKKKRDRYPFTHLGRWWTIPGSKRLTVKKTAICQDSTVLDIYQKAVIPCPLAVEWHKVCHILFRFIFIKRSLNYFLKKTNKIKIAWPHSCDSVNIISHLMISARIFYIYHTLYLAKKVRETLWHFRYNYSPSTPTGMISDQSSDLWPSGPPPSPYILSLWSRIESVGNVSFSSGEQTRELMVPCLIIVRKFWLPERNISSPLLPPPPQ